MIITKTVERVKSRALLRITAELRIDDPRGLSDAFAITADLYEPHGTWSGRAQFENGREMDAGGCMHDEILKFAPELAPLVAVHLADPDGVPMHAVANGWYFYSGEASAGAYDYNHEKLTDHQRGARALNIPPEDLPEGMDREQFEAFAESLRPLWLEQARVARELLVSL